MCARVDNISCARQEDRLASRVSERFGALRALTMPVGLRAERAAPLTETDGASCAQSRAECAGRSAHTARSAPR